MHRYHVHRPNRTTVSLPDELHGLLALRLGYSPDGAGAHRAVAQWLQAQVDTAADPGRRDLSQWLQAQAVLEISDNKLSNQYLEWLTGVAL